MILRELIRATTNFNYEVMEYTLFADGRHTKKMVEIKCESTNLRSKEYGLRHEKLIGDTWFILTKEEFEVQLRYVSMNKIIRRSKLGVLKPQPKIELSLVNRCILTTHFKERALERFGVAEAQIKNFLDKVLDGHYIVQNYRSYAKNKYNPEDLVVVTKDLKTLLVVTPAGGRFKLITCYSAGEAFSRWFQDNIETVHQMPTLESFYKGAA